MPFDSPALKRIAIRMATEYCNLCSLVVAPSESVAGLLKEREVTSPIEVVPTGIDLDAFAGGDGNAFRQRFDIPTDAKVIGHVGRLAKEKNLFFLAEAMVLRLREDPEAVFLLVGEGDHREEMLEILHNEVGADRIFAVGSQTGDDLADAYSAMDWFVFASQTETQGIVLAEAMAAGKPVVALDGPGVREILRDGENGYLLDAESTALDFATSLASLMEHPERSDRFSEGARRIVLDFGTDRCVQKMLDRYESLHVPQHETVDFSAWDRLRNGLQVEWDLFAARMAAATAAVMETPATEASLD